MSVSELHEKMEEAAHDSGNKLNRIIGITLAFLSVALALSTALLGSARTEFIGKMIQQGEAESLHLATTAKYRNIQLQLQELHALHADTDLPRRADVLRIAGQLHEYAARRNAAHDWSAAYADAVALFHFAERRYEWAQLLTELSIILASVALLLGSRRFWLISVGLGGLSFCFVAGIWFSVHRRTAATEARIETAHERFLESNQLEQDDADDARLLQSIEHG